MQRQTPVLGQTRHGVAHEAVGRDPARHHQAPQGRLSVVLAAKRPFGLDAQGFGHGPVEGGRDHGQLLRVGGQGPGPTLTQLVGAGHGRQGQVRAPGQLLGHGGFETAEAEIQVVVVDVGARKQARIGLNALRQLIQVAPAGIGQVEQLGHLVKGLARCVVQGASEQLESQRAVHAVQMRVPAGDQQAESRVAQLGFESWGQQVRVQVVHAEELCSRGQAQALGKGQAHQQRAQQARPARHGHGVDV